MSAFRTSLVVVVLALCLSVCLAWDIRKAEGSSIVFVSSYWNPDRPSGLSSTDEDDEFFVDDNDLIGDGTSMIDSDAVPNCGKPISLLFLTILLCKMIM
jgi:hypothetical protein